MNRTTRIKITELNPHVICVLCGGYFINATTIVECLHSFCRTCITRYLETSKYCPVCDVMVHKTRPLEYIRSDKTLQDLVYKLVPGLYKNEMKRRRDYYCEHDPPGVTPSPSEDRGDEFHDRIIYTEDEKISLSLELCAEGVPFKTPSAIHGHSGPENIKIKDVRYLHCPAAFSVGNLKKFIRMKFDLKMKYEIDIFHTAEPLPDYYTLMDIAYIYTWTRRAPVRLFYTVYERKLTPKAISQELENITKTVVNANTLKVDDIKQAVENVDTLPTTKQPPVKVKKDRIETKKRKFLEGPDDVSPDLDLEKSRSHHKKEGAPRKRAKKHLIVDSSVMEAMSESEEQFAKLTLNSSMDESRSNVKVMCDTDTSGGANSTGNKTSDSEEDLGANEMTSAGESVNKNDVAVTESDTGSGVSDQNNLKVDTCQEGAPATEHVSPGSISLSLFQPLNQSNAEKKDSDKLYEFTCEQTSAETLPALSKPKAKRGRKPKSEKTDDKCKADVCKETSVVANGGDGAKPTATVTPAKKVSKKDKLKDKKVSDTPNVPKKPKGSGEKSSKASESVNGNNVERVKRKYVRKKPLKSAKALDSKDVVNDGNSHPTDVTTVDNSCDSENSQTKPPEITKCGDTTLEKEKCQSGSKSETNNTDSDVTEPVSDASAQHNSERLNSSEPEQSGSENKPEVPTQSGPVPQPITPLYGKTPKMSELSEGVPVSPVPECAEKGAIISGGDVTGVNMGGIGANRGNSDSQNNEATVTSVSSGAKAASDVGTVSCSTSEAVKSSSTLLSAKRPILPHPMYKPITGSQLVNNGFIRGLVPGNVAFNSYANLVSMAPVSVGCLIGGFPQINAAPGHVLNGMPGHVTGSYALMEQSSDQPLDLTNNGHREEYMKGKIFKTKMLKKTYTRTDGVINNVSGNKDKQTGGNGINGSTWT